MASPSFISRIHSWQLLSGKYKSKLKLGSLKKAVEARGAKLSLAKKQDLRQPTFAEVVPQISEEFTNVISKSPLLPIGNIPKSALRPLIAESNKDIASLVVKQLKT